MNPTNRDELLHAIEDVKNLKPDQIALALRKRKIVGRPGTTGRCPLALMMQGSHGGHFVVGQKFIIRQSGAAVDKIATPKNLAAFVRMFDEGRFRELIQVPPRCVRGGKQPKPGLGRSGKHHVRKRGAERLQLARMAERFPTKP